MPTIDQVADAVALFRAKAVAIFSAQITEATIINGHPVRLEPGSLPAVMLDMVTIHRVDPDQGDSQLGTRDWHIELPVEIYVDAVMDVQNPAISSALAERLACKAIATIDADPTMGNWGSSGGIYSGVEAVMTSAEPFVGALNDTGHPVLGYSAVLHAFLLLPETT